MMSSKWLFTNERPEGELNGLRWPWAMSHHAWL